jgi:hypothetical protein
LRKLNKQSINKICFSGVAPIFAISFMGFGVGKKLLAEEEGKPLSNTRLFLAGAFSGIFTTSVMAPGERIKCLLQVQQGGGEQRYNGMVDCAKKLYKEGGIRNIYKGSLATLLRGKSTLLIFSKIASKRYRNKLKLSHLKFHYRHAVHLRNYDDERFDTPMNFGLVSSYFLRG